MLPLQGFIRLWHFLFLILKPVHCVPDTCSSDIESFRLYGQFLVGPERNRISYNKIFWIYGLNFGYMVNFYGELKPNRV